MFITFSRPPALTERNSTMDIDRLLGLLETAIDQQAHIIEEIIRTQSRGKA